jgi:hypothetical protein
MSWAEHHRDTERFTEAAETALREGRAEAAEELYSLASDSERLAFEALTPEKVRTRGISAVGIVALAYKARNFTRAQELAYRFLGKEALPPFAVSQLRNLVQTIWTEEAIAAAGVKFSKDDVLVAVRGGQIMTGGAPLDLILRKVEEVRAMFYRTVEMLMQVPLRVRGAPKYEIQQLFRPWLIQAPTGSYQFAVRLESPPQLELGLGARHVPAVDEVTRKFIDIVSSAASDPEHALATVVPDEGYRKTFLKLARNLAPTGQSFSELEIKSAIRPQSDGIVFAPSARKAIDETIKKSSPPPAADGGERVIFTGILRAVHLDQDWLEVTVNDPDERHIRVDNAGEAIDDVVGPMINRGVKLSARRLTTGKFSFEDIEPIE